MVRGTLAGFQMPRRSEKEAPVEERGEVKEEEEVEEEKEEGGHLHWLEVWGRQPRKTRRMTPEVMTVT